MAQRLPPGTSPPPLDDDYQEPIERPVERIRTSSSRSSGGFLRGLKNFFSTLGAFFVLLGVYLPQVLAVLIFILSFYMVFADDMPFGNIIFIAIPCAILFFAGWKGLIGILVVAGLAYACTGC